MRPGPGEPVFGEWRSIPLSAFVERMLAERPRVVVIDGRSGSGKSTLAERLVSVAGGTVVHVDDVAWHAPMFGWSSLLAEGVLEQATAFWHEWMASEVPFLQRDRPWERADFVVAGTSPDPATVVVAGG